MIYERMYLNALVKSISLFSDYLLKAGNTSGDDN